MLFQKKNIILLLFITITSNGFSQFINYIDGYVVKENRDTIYGQLRELNAEKSCLKIKFIDSKGNKVKFKDKEVYAYKRGDDLYYKKTYERPISISNMKGFMKLMVKGKVNLYKFNYVEKNVGVMDSNGGMIPGGNSYRKDYYIEKKNSNLFLVTKIGFKHLVANYLSDNFDLANKIRNKELKYRDIKEIVRTYNKEHD